MFAPPIRVLAIRVLALLTVATAAGDAVAQGTRADYDRARAIARRYSGKVRNVQALQWLPGGDLIARRFADGADAPEFVRITPDGAVTTGAALADLGVGSPLALVPRTERSRSRDGGGRVSVTFENDLAQPVRLVWVDRRGRRRSYGEIAPGESKRQSTRSGHAWHGVLPGDGLAGVFVATGVDAMATFGEESREAVADSTRRPARRPGQRPRGGANRRSSGLRVVCRDDNVWLTRAGEERQLTSDGTATSSYRGRVWLSPRGDRALAFQVEVAQVREIHTIESAPSDQLQPKLHSQRYRKPGDELDRPRPRLFDLTSGDRIEVDQEPFMAAWSIGRVRWADDGSEVYLLHNRRGHQALTLFAIDASTGVVRAVLEERSATFVDYSQKTVLRWLDGSGEYADQFLWASERSGFNHLYRVDARSGAVTPVTQGEWVFRGLERVDLEAEEVWFTALGIHPDQDPYHSHLSRVRLDGSGLTVLTDGDGTHRWEFSPDGSQFVDRWSRVDQPEVVELRRSNDGALVAEVGRTDASLLLEAGFRPPLRFVAPGRDGKTPIYGILILPSNFDPAQNYPVVEAIYAGPHDFHVSKGWSPMTRQRELAELGFVVARIDGMGTNWRSKAFHDVCWRNLKDAGLPDRIAWLRAAAEEHPFLDLERVGIYGGSAGGQNALGAVLHHGDFYDVAAADCGCHDNRMDKIWWNEAWMGYPIGEWYADSSNVTHASKLTGKLLLTVGERDRNVDPASTMQVVKALIDADKDFDLVVVPGGGHGVGETDYLRRRRQDFFVRHLLGVEPRTR